MSTSADSASSFESGGMLSGVSSQSAESGISDASEAGGSSSTASTSTAGPASLPSSAAVERAFSLLANSFGDRQQNALEDYVEASVML